MNFCCHSKKMHHREINLKLMLFAEGAICMLGIPRECLKTWSLYVLRKEQYFFTKLFEEHWKLTGEWISLLSSKSNPPLSSIPHSCRLPTMACPSSRPLVDVTNFLLQAPFLQFIALFQPQSTAAREADFRSSPLPQLLQNQFLSLLPSSVAESLLWPPLPLWPPFK